LVIDARLYSRLVALAERARARSPELAARFLEEVERADLRAPGDMPADAVTLGSEVTFRRDGRMQTVCIVVPEEADIDRRRISVVTPVGAALLGLRVGQRITWEMPDKRIAELEIVAVRQQESAHH
jgi:regulator of nucleoside diphosphate kinase